MTIDFSPRIESGVKVVFPEVPIQKCIFHATQLFSRGLLKELIRIKNKQIQSHIKEWNLIRKISIDVEKEKKEVPTLSLTFVDTEIAWKLHEKLRKILTQKKFHDIERNMLKLFTTSEFKTWKGKRVFLEKYNVIFTTRKLIYSPKSLKYIVDKVFKAWRAAIRRERMKLEASKTHFNQTKYLILMNPQNMDSHHRKKLRESLKEFPWLRSYRRIITTFYYQFRLPPEKRRSLNFLTQLQTENCHPWLNSAINTLIENEGHVFRFQSIRNLYPELKHNDGIKVVNESSNKVINQLYRTQCGMRTLENIRMRISNRLECPIFTTPNLIEKSK